MIIISEYTMTKNELKFLCILSVSGHALLCCVSGVEKVGVAGLEVEVVVKEPVLQPAGHHHPLGT